MADAGSSGTGDTQVHAAGDPHSAVIMAAKEEVELMMRQIAAQSQAPALFSATLSEACRGQHLADFIRILVEMGGIGPALSEMQSASGSNYAPPVDMFAMQGMPNMQGMQSMEGMQAMQDLNHMAPLDLQSIQDFNRMSSQFSFPFIASGCQTPRSREQLSSANPVELELVGTTLVAKTANESVKLDMECLSASLEKNRKNYPMIILTHPGGAANMQNSRIFSLTVRGKTVSGVLFGNGTCKLSQVQIQPSPDNVKPIFFELQRVINELSIAGVRSCIQGGPTFEFQDVTISLLKQQFKLPFHVKYSRVEALLAMRPHYFCEISTNRPQTGQGCRFKLTSHLLQMLQVSGIVGAQVYYSGMVQVDGSKNCSLEEHHIVCNWISQFFTIHAVEIQPQPDDAADGSKRKRSRPAKKLKLHLNL